MIYNKYELLNWMFLNRVNHDRCTDVRFKIWSSGQFLQVDHALGHNRFNVFEVAQVGTDLYVLKWVLYYEYFVAAS